jgi:hypothetical protein
MPKWRPFRTATHSGDWTPTGRAYIVMHTPADRLDAAIMREVACCCGMIARHEIELPYNPEEQ